MFHFVHNADKQQTSAVKEFLKITRLIKTKFLGALNTHTQSNNFEETTRRNPITFVLSSSDSSNSIRNKI
jgi:hypothetical protein